jgi:hypothetical protein
MLEDELRLAAFLDEKVTGMAQALTAEFKELRRAMEENTTYTFLR